MNSKLVSKFKHREIEIKWQKRWEAEGIYSPDLEHSKKPFYNLMMFPYPSAEGLHVGNMYAFTGVDVYGRFMRMRGFDVFEPIGLDGFGIHSENYALKVNRHPKDQAKISATNFYRQLRAIGNGFDFQHTLETYDPDYYRWTQWLFVQMFKHGLAYRAKANVNWCPSDKTVLADEQVINEKCERCGATVEKKELEQWFFRITAYAERLLQNTYKPSFKWSEKVKIGQQNWIGKKEGIDIIYKIENSNKTVTCWTSRPDTNFGATFIVIAPENPLTLKITSKENIQNVTKYIKDAKNRTKEERISEGVKKTGAFTGAYAINNLNNERMPIWVSDFVIWGVGTGAVVGVPGHDMRDFEFAKAMNISIKRVVVGSDGDSSKITKPQQVQEAEGTMVNSDFLNGLNIHIAAKKVMDFLEAKGFGKRNNNYHLRDWLISRQRYWGAPIPMIYCEYCAQQQKSWFDTEESSSLQIKDDNKTKMYGWYPVSEGELPVELPDVENWRPTGTGRGPLAGVPEFYETKCPYCGQKAVRETDVCDTFLDSSWYFLRYPSIHAVDADKKAFNSEITKHWLPVHSYIGGAEHTVLHLLYARFVWMALRDWGHIDLKNQIGSPNYNPDEPFQRFFAHGLIIKDGAKMSKSKGNVVIPDEYIQLYGADALRTYLMFLGPFESGGDFRDTGILGMHKWLSRVWRLSFAFANNTPHKNKNGSPQSLKILNQTIKSVTSDIEQLHYNTAIAKLMECVNWWMEHESEVDQSFISQFLLLLAPFAPHLTEELYFLLHGKDKSQQYSSIHKDSWPAFDSSLIIPEKVTLVIQINGKLRDSLELSVNEAQEQDKIEQLAQKTAKISKWLVNKPIKKVVFVPGKLINFVV